MADSIQTELEKKLLEDFQTSLQLPPASEHENVGTAVWALFKHAMKAYKVWWAANDEDRNYYKGKQLGRRPSYKSKIVDNETKSMIKTQTPNIINAINEPDLLPRTPDDIEGAKALSQRVKSAKRDSQWRKQKKHIVKNIMKDGGVYIKCDSSVTARRIDWRRIVREPEAASFNEANYYFDQILETAADTEAQFGAKAKNLKASIDDIEANENLSHGPTDFGSFRPGMTLSWAPPNESSPVTRYAYDKLEDDFVKANRVLRMELFVRDKTKKKVHKGKAVEDKETGKALQEKDGDGNLVFEEVESSDLLYPHGRVINFVVGVNELNNVIPRGEGRASKPMVTVLMDRPNGFTSLYNNTAVFDKDGNETMPGRYLHTEILMDDPEEGDVWVQSIIRDGIPLQDAVNDAWNQMMDNVDKVVNPTKLISKLTGLKIGQITGRPNEEILINAPDIDLNNLIKYVEIPPIIQHMIIVIREAKDAYRKQARVPDVSRGERPGAITAGNAIIALQNKAESGMLEIAERISDGFAEVEETLAYISMDFDGEKPMFLLNEDATDEEKFTEFNPAEVKKTKIRVSGVRRKSASEKIELITAVIALEKELPGSGMMILKDDEDPSMFEFLTKLRKDAEEAEKDRVLGENNHEVALAAAKAGVPRSTNT